MLIYYSIIFLFLLMFYYNLRLDFILVMKSFSVNYNFIRFDEIFNEMQYAIHDFSSNDLLAK
jgi:hypothetical protein